MNPRSVLQVELQPVPFRDIGALVDAHVAPGVDLVRGLLVAHPVGEDRDPALAQPRAALRFGILVGVAAQDIGLQKDRKLLIPRGRRQQEERRLRLQLEPFLGGRGQRQRAQKGERDAL
jgi:hypothetical protein